MYVDVIEIMGGMGGKMQSNFQEKILNCRMVSKKNLKVQFYVKVEQIVGTLLLHELKQNKSNFNSVENTTTNSVFLLKVSHYLEKNIAFSPQLSLGEHLNETSLTLNMSK